MSRFGTASLVLALSVSSFASSHDYGKHPARNLAARLAEGKPVCCATNLRRVEENLLSLSHAKDPRRNLQIASGEPVLWACCLDGQVTKRKSRAPKLAYGKDPRQHLADRESRTTVICCP